MARLFPRLRGSLSLGLTYFVCGAHVFLGSVDVGGPLRGNSTILGEKAGSLLLQLFRRVDQRTNSTDDSAPLGWPESTSNPRGPQCKHPSRKNPPPQIPSRNRRIRPRRRHEVRLHGGVQQAAGGPLRPGRQRRRRVRLAPLPRRPGDRTGTDDDQDRRRLGGLARRSRRDGGAVQPRRHGPCPGPAQHTTTSSCTTRASPTRPSGRCTTTSSHRRSSTGPGGTPTARSTKGSPTPSSAMRTTAPPSGSRTTSCSWCRACSARHGRTSGSGSSTTSPSRPRRSSPSCPGGRPSSTDCSARTWWASSGPATPATSCARPAASWAPASSSSRSHVKGRDGQITHIARAQAFPISIDVQQISELAGQAGHHRAGPPDPPGPGQPQNHPAGR